MEIFVQPELARLATRSGFLLPFVIWSAIRSAELSNIIKSNPYKSQVKRILRARGMNYTDRHFQRIWNQGAGIFWGLSDKRLYPRSFQRVYKHFASGMSEKDENFQPQDRLFPIKLSKSLQELQAQIYLAWLSAKGEITLSRATMQDLFGFSPDVQRSLEALLAERLKVFFNYAHIDLSNYEKSPSMLPEHSFTIQFKREIRFDEDIDTVTYIQYQLPNTFLARPDEHSESSDAVRASNAVRKAARTLARRTLAAPPLRRYYLKWSDFERNGNENSYIRCYFQGRKKLFLLGHYL